MIPPDISIDAGLDGGGSSITYFVRAWPMGTLKDLSMLNLGEFIDREIDNAFDYVRSKRAAGTLTDKRFVRLGINRVLQNNNSGRDYLQKLKECTDDPLARATFFDALHSSRRCAMVEEAAQGLGRVIAREMGEANVDYLADFDELAPFRVLAGDGHTIAHSSHAAKNQKGNSEPSSTIYLQDLRTGLMESFAPVSGNGNRKHEMPVFRRTLLDCQNTTSNPVKTIFVLDRAFIDGLFWKPPPNKPKPPGYVITRMKTNMTPVCFDELEFDRNDPVNAGVTRVWMGGFTSACGIMHVVDYVDPETGQMYQFLTTLNPDEIRPGVIAYLYFLRWRIEKSFDTFKSDFRETKAWAGGKDAQIMHSSFIAMAYNLTRFLLSVLEKNHGIHDEKVERKYEKELQRRAQTAEGQKRSIHPLHQKMRRMPKLSAQYIRTIRNHIGAKMSILALLPVFTETLTGYL